MMAASELNSAMRRRSSAVWPSLLVMKIVWARARCDGGSRNVPRGSRCSLPNGCWRSTNTTSCRRPRRSPILKTIVEQQRVAAEFFYRITPAFHAVLVHEHDDIPEIGRQHVGFVAGHFRIEQQRFAVGNHARRGLVFAQEDFIQQPLVKRRRFGTVAA